MISSLLIINTHCQITPVSSLQAITTPYSIPSAHHHTQGETALSFEIPITHNPFLSVWQQWMVYFPSLRGEEKSFSPYSLPTVPSALVTAVLQLKSAIYIMNNIIGCFKNKIIY